jgi:hypothetical protein
VYVLTLATGQYSDRDANVQAVCASLEGAKALAIMYHDVDTDGMTSWGEQDWTDVGMRVAHLVCWRPFRDAEGDWLGRYYIQRFMLRD